MHIKKNIISLTGLLFLLFAETATIFAGNQDVSAIKAMQLFDSGKYPEAERMFRVLLENDKENPMLNYYYGASRTENGHFDDATMQHLLFAGKNVTPDRLHYYLGIQHHARGDWEKALKFYNQFKLSVPEKEQQELALTQKIQQCFDKTNPFTGGEIAQRKKKDENKQETEITDAPVQETVPVIPDPVDKDERQPETGDNLEKENPGILSASPKVPATEPFTFQREALPDLPGVKSTFTPPPGEPVEFQVNNDITYLYSSQFQTEEGKRLFEKGDSLQNKLESNLDEADKLRKKYQNTEEQVDKIATGKKILSLERESFELQEKINRYFTEARNIENEYWQNAGSTAIHNFLIKQEKIKASLNEDIVEAELTSDTGKYTTPVLLPGSISDLYGLPDARQEEQKSGEVVYKIQIGAYSRGVPAYRQRLFNKLSLLRKIENYTDEDGVTVYTTGTLTNLEDALKMQSQVKQEGVEDAIVVPYINGKRITLEQAKKIEAGDDFERN